MYEINVIVMDSPLGDQVELRELTADQFFDANEEASIAMDAGSDRAGQYVWLSKMLWVDGKQFSPDEIRNWGASATVPLLTRMQKLFPEMYLDDGDDAGEDGEQEPQNPNA